MDLATFSHKGTVNAIDTGGASRHYVHFRVDRQSYALPLDQVTRAIRMVAFSTIPKMAAYVQGMITLAGKVIPVMDLRRYFGQKPKEPELTDRLLIVRVENQTVAVAVDEVLKVLTFTAQQMEPPPPNVSRSPALVAAAYRDDDLILVLDACRLLPQNIEDAGEENAP